MMSNVFKGLDHLGFTMDKDIEIYKADTTEPKKILEEQKSNYLFHKQVRCPVCENIFKTPSVKVNSPRITSKDSDLFIRYATINPYFYEVYICNKCGYSALKSDFLKIREFQKVLIKKEITPKWKGRTYPEIFTEEIAIERYKLALLNAVLSDARSSTKAMICLKIAWMYRLLKDSTNENLFITNSIEGFTKAYSEESFPVYGLDSYSISYLLGDLNRRIGQNSDALNWLSKVIIAPGINPRLKELARDCKDLIKK